MLPRGEESAETDPELYRTAFDRALRDVRGGATSPSSPIVFKLRINEEENEEEEEDDDGEGCRFANVCRTAGRYLDEGEEEGLVEYEYDI